MVQKEVACRLIAEPGTADYAAVTLAVRMFGDAAVTRTVDRRMFRPRTQRGQRRGAHHPRPPTEWRKRTSPLVKKTVRAAFAMRRKTLANNLSAAFGISKQQATELVTGCGFPADIRGERLSLDDFIRLSRAFLALKKREYPRGSAP